MNRNYEHFAQNKMKNPRNYTNNKNPLQIDTITVNDLSRGLPVMITKSIKKTLETNQTEENNIYAKICPSTISTGEKIILR